MGAGDLRDPETLALLRYHDALRHLEAATLAWAELDYAQVRDRLSDAREDLRQALRLLDSLD